MSTGQVAGHSLAHESASAQLTGRAQYIDDLPEIKGTLFAAPICSPQAHGVLKGLDCSDALAMPGVVKVIQASDLRGDPFFSNFTHDEPIFAITRVEHVGQVMGLVIASDVNTARLAARRVKAVIEPLPSTLTIEEALAAQTWVLPPVTMIRGDAALGLSQAIHRLSGQTKLGGQEHFYLEGQVAYAIPQEQGRMFVHSSSQHPGEVQHWVAHALQLPMHLVTVETRRMGGGFGGKETQAGHLAVWAAVASQLTGHPVKMRLDRDEDFMITGKRHNFLAKYDVGFDAQGRIHALKVMLASQCGFSADLSGPVNDRAMFHLDNAYYLEHLQIDSFRCKTHTQSNTAFRGFGGPQGMFVIETIMGEIGRFLSIDALLVRQRNLYDKLARNTTPYGMVVSSASRGHSTLESSPSKPQARPRAYPGEVWYFVYSHAIQPGRSACAGLYRWECVGSSWRHRDGTRAAYQGLSDRGR
jgi:xanthine dehydrogenase large subunit